MTAKKPREVKLITSLHITDSFISSFETESLRLRRAPKDTVLQMRLSSKMLAYWNIEGRGKLREVMIEYMLQHPHKEEPLK